MVRFKLRVHPEQRLMYVPIVLKKIIGENPEAIPNAFGLFLYDPNTPKEKIVKSLQIILEDLKLSIE